MTRSRDALTVLLGTDNQEHLTFLTPSHARLYREAKVKWLPLNSRLLAYCGQWQGAERLLAVGVRGTLGKSGPDLKGQAEQVFIKRFQRQVSDIDLIRQERDLAAQQAAETFIHDIRHSWRSQVFCLDDARSLLNQLPARTQEADVRVKNAETLQELASARLELFAEELSGISEIIPHSTHSVVPRVPFQIFDHVCRALRPRAVQRNIVFDYDAIAKTPLALPRVFSIVPFILLENAIKYSSDGARIKITAREDGTRVQLSVTSNGPTIEENEKDRIFERNGRGRNAIGNSAGNGLGLFTAQRIVKVACQGTLTVECSQVANGRCTVTFTTSLPIISSAQAAHLAVR